MVGSNTANILLVLGFPAILAVLHTSALRHAQVLPADDRGVGHFHRFGVSVGSFDWISGVILLSLLFYILSHAVMDAKAHRKNGCSGVEEEEPEGADPDMPWWKIMVFLVLGLIGLPLGADLLIDSAEILARRYGVSESVIGLTLVALGTSLARSWPPPPWPRCADKRM